MISGNINFIEMESGGKFYGQTVWEVKEGIGFLKLLIPYKTYYFYLLKGRSFSDRVQRKQTSFNPHWVNSY